MSITDILQIIPAQAESANPIVSLLPLILMFVILYFLMIRPQMKRQREHRNLVANLTKGDEVVTNGGILGKITKVQDNYVTVEISQQGDKAVEAVFQRQSVASVLPKGTIKSL